MVRKSCRKSILANDPVGNGPDGQLNTDDDVVIKDLYVVEGDLRKPPLGGEAAAGMGHSVEEI